MGPLASPSIGYGIAAAAPRKKSATGYSATVIADSPDAYWQLGESSGTIAADSIGNAHPGAYGGSYTLGESGSVVGGGTSVLFGLSSDSRVDCGAVGNYTSGDFTLEFWIKGNSFGANPIVIGKGPYSVGGYFIQCTPGTINVFINQLGGAQVYSSPGGSISAGDWHYVAIVRATSTISIYIDGELSGGTQTFTDDPASSLQSFLIANYTGLSNSPDAFMNEVAIYSHALSATRVLEHYNVGTGA